MDNERFFARIERMTGQWHEVKPHDWPRLEETTNDAPLPGQGELGLCSRKCEPGPFSTLFLAGGTGAVGKSLVPRLLESGHEVVAISRTPWKIGELDALGAKVAVADALDREALTATIRKAEPEVIKTLIHTSRNFPKPKSSMMMK